VRPRTVALVDQADAASEEVLVTGISASQLARADRVRKARRSSTCPSCQEPILVSMSIARLVSPAAWVHLRCVPAVRAAALSHRETSTEEERS
jgi:hypothetical protein